MESARNTCETATRMNFQGNIYELNAKLKAEREAEGTRLERPVAVFKRVIRKFRLSRFWQREAAKVRASFLRVIRKLPRAVRFVARKREVSTSGPGSCPGPGDDDDPDPLPRSSGAISPFENSPFIKLKFTISRGVLSARRAFAMAELLAVLVARWTR